MDPKLLKAHLDKYRRAKLLPNAVLIEYIPNMKMTDPKTFPLSRIQKLISIFNEMYEAKVYYRDVFPRNMMVVKESQTEFYGWISTDLKCILAL